MNKHEQEPEHGHCCDGCCDSCHEEENESKHLLPRLMLAFALLLTGWLVDRYFDWYIALPVYLIAYVIAGYDTVINAVKGVAKGRVFGECFLMTVATVGAFCIGDFAEGVAVMIFYGLGEYIQDLAVDKSSAAINTLIRMRPDHATIYENGKKTVVPPSEVKVGQVIAVAPGERVPLDGILLSSTASADTTAVTGESAPRDFVEGDEIISGIINMKSEILVKVTHSLSDSSTERIFRMVTEAREKKSRSERFITRFAKVYTPAVVGAAAVVALVPPIFLGNFSEWIHRGLIFLVASCPCAVVLSVPLTYFAGMGLASRNGILFKGGAYLERLAAVNTAAFDKTGTLTKGELEIVKISPAEGVSEEELLHMAAHAESKSAHPIAAAIAARGSCDSCQITDFEELTGGISAKVNDVQLVAGNTALTGVENDSPYTAVHVLREGKLLGSIYLADTPRDDAKAAVRDLKRLNIAPVMITGDGAAAAGETAAALDITKLYSQVLPGEKLDIVKKLNGTVAFVGDGINDAPALSGADIGIAMGGLGREAAMEAADVVIMDDSPSKVPLAVRIAKKVNHTAAFNITFALSFKALVLVLGAAGIANMWLAVFADVGVALIAVAVAVLRCRKV